MGNKKTRIRATRVEVMGIEDKTCMKKRFENFLSPTLPF